jgi:hypothetical protein
LPQTDHFLFQAWPVFAIPLVLAGVTEGYRMLPHAWRPVATAAIGVAALVAGVHFATMQVRATNDINKTYAMSADEAAVFQWIESNLGETDTVVTPSWITNQQLAALTPASTYLADGFITRVSTEELASRYLRLSAAFGIDEETAFHRIDPARDVPTSDKNIPDEELERYFDTAMVYYLFNEAIRRPSTLTDRFPAWRREFDGLVDEASVLSPFEADYLFCGHRERFWSTSAVAPGTWVEEAFSSGDTTLYRIVSENDVGATEFAGCQPTAGS